MKLCHNFSKNILTKLKRYATMVATSGNRDVRLDILCQFGLITDFHGWDISNNWWAEIRRL